MKKNYEKPMVMLENFELNQHIASGCGVIVVENPDGSANIVKDPNQPGLKPIENVFYRNIINSCKIEGVQYCYHDSQDQSGNRIGTHTSL